MSLTAAQKAAGRAFRDDRAARLAALPPAAPCSPYIREYRHACPRVSGASLVIRMKEHYEASPRYLHCYCGLLAALGAGGDFPHEDCQGSREAVAEGLFAFIWTDGKCPCSLAVRSSGRLVLAADRPPDKR